MNALGHAYVTVQAVPDGQKDLLIVGALLPESSPFIADNPFSWEEIHESGEKFLRFLDERYPEKRDLALGILAHSYKLGADKFNKEVEKYAGLQRGELLKKIAECSNVDLKTAEYRLHNFLWWGVDIWLLREYPEHANDIQRTIREVEVGKIGGLLAQAFGKEKQRAERIVEVLFREIYQPKDLASVEGLACTWARQAAGLPEKDRVDVPKTAALFKECAGLLKDDWRKIVVQIETRVGENLRPFVEKEGAKKLNKEQEP